MICSSESSYRFLAHCATQDGKIAVTVGTITDDKRLFEVPKVRVAALKVTDAARARIMKVCAAALPHCHMGA